MKFSVNFSLTKKNKIKNKNWGLPCNDLSNPVEVESSALGTIFLIGHKISYQLLHPNLIEASIVYLILHFLKVILVVSRDNDAIH